MRFSDHLGKHQAEGRHSPGGLRVTLGFCSSQEEMKREKSIAVGPTMRNAVELCTVVVCALAWWDGQILSLIWLPLVTLFAKRRVKLLFLMGNVKLRKQGLYKDPG